LNQIDELALFAVSLEIVSIILENKEAELEEVHFEDDQAVDYIVPIE